MIPNESKGTLMYGNYNSKQIDRNHQTSGQGDPQTMFRMQSNNNRKENHQQSTHVPAHEQDANFILATREARLLGMWSKKLLI